MFQKTFQIVLVAFLVIFTAAGAVLLVSAITSFLLPSETSGIFVVAGGVSNSFLRVVVVMVVLVTVAIAFLIARRNRLR